MYASVVLVWGGLRRKRDQIVPVLSVVDVLG